MKKLNDRKIEQTVDPKLECLLATRSARWSSKQAAHQASGQARPTNLLVKGKKKVPTRNRTSCPYQSSYMRFNIYNAPDTVFNMGKQKKLISN